MRIVDNEHPNIAWPQDCVNVKDRTILDLGCGFFGMSSLFKQGKMEWAGIKIPNMISTSEHWLNLGANMVIGVDTNANDIACLREVLKHKNTLFYQEEIRSPWQINYWVARHGVDVIKADIEGFEYHIINMSDADFSLVKEYYVETHNSDLTNKMYNKFAACGYNVREAMKLANNGPDVLFAYKKV